MSAVKFAAYQPYKLYDVGQPTEQRPQFHPERPIIVDADAIESPETVTLRFEEEAAARANGCLRGDESPPGLLSKSFSKSQPPQMHGFESSRSYQDPQYQYPAQSFPAPSPENAAAQLNQLAFAANNSASQYMAPVGPALTVSSYQPTSGVSGTRVTRCAAHAIPDRHDTSGYGYIVSGESPPFDDTRGGNVPLSVLIETTDAQTLASISVGTFTYHDAQVGSVGRHSHSHTQVGSECSPPEDVTRKTSQSPEHRNSPPTLAKQEQTDQLSEAPTNTYGYPSAAQQASTYDPTYASNDNSMIGTYHRTSYAGDYSRHIPPPLKAPSPWSPFGLSTSRSPAMSHTPHTTITRPSITSLPAPTHNSTQLVRTSTLQASGSPGSGQFNPYALYSAKAVLKVVGQLDSMANNWSKEEWENRRRIVLFKKQQQGSTLTTTFRPVSVNERPTNSICVSCIWWAEKQECYVTSVDTIHLLEQLVAAPARFTVEEKNRIRRNLEGFRPLTVSKAKADSEEFFKIIMAFPNPKPRNIEKDVKVFPWKILEPALKKIISKYSASPSSTMGPGPMLTPVGSSSPGFYPPHTPTIHEGHYAPHDHHGISSPRSLSGGSSSWAYPASAGRAMYGDLKSHSPTAGNIRIPSLPSSVSTAYGNGDRQNYSMAPQPQSRWDTSAVTQGYIDAAAVPAYTSHQHQSQVYGTSAYGDGAQRA